MRENIAQALMHPPPGWFTFEKEDDPVLSPGPHCDLRCVHCLLLHSSWRDRQTDSLTLSLSPFFSLSLSPCVCDPDHRVIRLTSGLLSYGVCLLWKERLNKHYKSDLCISRVSCMSKEIRNKMGTGQVVLVLDAWETDAQKRINQRRESDTFSCPADLMNVWNFTMLQLIVEVCGLWANQKREKSMLIMEIAFQVKDNVHVVDCVEKKMYITNMCKKRRARATSDQQGQGTSLPPSSHWGTCVGGMTSMGGVTSQRGWHFWGGATSWLVSWLVMGGGLENKSSTTVCSNTYFVFFKGSEVKTRKECHRAPVVVTTILDWTVRLAAVFSRKEIGFQYCALCFHAAAKCLQICVL